MNMSLNLSAYVYVFVQCKYVYLICSRTKKNVYLICSRAMRMNHKSSYQEDKQQVRHILREQEKKKTATIFECVFIRVVNEVGERGFCTISTGHATTEKHEMMETRKHVELLKIT